MRRGFLPIVVAAILLVACSKDGPTSGGGQVVLALDGATIGSFELADGVPLRADAQASGDPRFLGRCVLSSAATDVELERGTNSGGAPSGFVWFRLRVDSPEAPHVGHVLASVGDAVYEADCDLTTFARDRDVGVFDVAIDRCALLSPTPSSGASSVVVSAELGFEGCEAR